MASQSYDSLLAKPPLELGKQARKLRRYRSVRERLPSTFFGRCRAIFAAHCSAIPINVGNWGLRHNQRNKSEVFVERMKNRSRTVLTSYWRSMVSLCPCFQTFSAAKQTLLSAWAKTWQPLQLSILEMKFGHSSSFLSTWPHICLIWFRDSSPSYCRWNKQTDINISVADTKRELS